MPAIFLPRSIKIGAESAMQLASALAEQDLKAPLIVTDPIIAGGKAFRAVKSRLVACGIEPRVFDGVVPNPTSASVDAALEFVSAGNLDCVIGFGGGSAIDTAKAVAVLAVHGGTMHALKAPHRQDAPGLPIVAIPTTAGSGSEATRFTIITDEATNEKMLCMGLAYLPTLAIVDHELTMTKPRRLSADTGIDALTHAIEAYVSNLANPFSDGMALSAMRLIWPNLPRVCEEPDNRAARAAMAAGSLQAGIAFSNSSVALVHGMSRPIGAHFQVSHGLSNAMLLPSVTAWSSPASLTRYAECAHAMTLASADEGEQSAVDRLIEALYDLNNALDVPTLAGSGIDRQRWHELIPLMSEQALSSGSPANNPRVPDIAQISQLYADAWV